MDAKLTRQILYGLFLLILLGMFKKAGAEQPLNVAVAANFAPAMEMISQAYTAETGIPVQLTVSSSGRFFAQISQRAPVDLFFSADAKRPELLHDQGLCLSPEIYARGRVVLWSRDKTICEGKDWKQVLLSPVVGKVAIANPATAPYGAVAASALERLADWPRLRRKLVFGANVGQAFQYARSGVAQVSLVALSFALSASGMTGCYREIPETTTVEQKACVIAYGKYKDSAGQFLRYATSARSTPLLRKFGYK